jgi:hypothetical protein
MYDLFVKSKKARPVVAIIQSKDDEPVGFIRHAPEMWGSNIQVWGYELKPGISYLKVTPSVIRYLQLTAQEYAKKKEKVEFQGYNFNLGAEHPVYESLPERMPRVGKPYAWYIRIPNLSGFLVHIKSVLEKRLLDSPAVGHTGDFKVNFYKSALKLVFKDGILTRVEPYNPEHGGDGDVFYPELTFLQAVTGYKSFNELSETFPDCYAKNDHGRALAKFLFPKKTSNVWAIN